MTNNNHQDIINKFDSELKIIERLMGGMSNYTYLCSKNDKKFVFRIPGEGGYNFVNYTTEANNLNHILPLNINTRTVFIDPENGYKISEYIEGTMIDDNVDLNLVTKTLKQLHNYNTLFDNNYDHLKRLETYELLHQNNEVKYLKLKESFLKLFDKYLKQHLDTPCHNDAQIANMIVDENQKLYLLDWEFAGNNDKIYDIASFGNKDFNQALKLLNVYYQNPKNNHYIRLYAWRMFQCLQWFNVASYKQEIGLSEKLNIPFDKVAANYITLAEQMYNSCTQYIKDEL
jgi:thiamine kinase-like enzyme